MSEEIIKVVDSLASKFGIAIDWTSQNVMPCLQELMERYIKYDTTINILTIVFLLILTFVLFKTFFKTYKRYKKEFEDGEDDEIYFCFTLVIGIVLLIVIVFELVLIPTGFSRVIQNIFIPELTMIEKIQSLIGG